MSSFLQHLQNNEAVMLMYLADELPPEDRLEFEQMLAGDARLRAELAALQQAQNVVSSALFQLDLASTLPASAVVAGRQVGRLLRQRHLEKLTNMPPAVVRGRRKVPRWVFWTSGAAAAMVGIVVWWGLNTDSSPVDVAQDTSQAEQEDQARLLEATLPTTEDGVAQAEHDASILVARSNEVAADPSALGNNDPVR